MELLSGTVIYGDDFVNRESSNVNRTALNFEVTNETLHFTLARGSDCETFRSFTIDV